MIKAKESIYIPPMEEKLTEVFTLKEIEVLSRWPIVDKDTYINKLLETMSLETHAEMANYYMPFIIESMTRDGEINGETSGKMMGDLMAYEDFENVNEYNDFIISVALMVLADQILMNMEWGNYYDE